MTVDWPRCSVAGSIVGGAPGGAGVVTGVVVAVVAAGVAGTGCAPLDWLLTDGSPAWPNGLSAALVLAGCAGVVPPTGWVPVNMSSSAPMPIRVSNGVPPPPQVGAARLVVGLGPCMN